MSDAAPVRLFATDIDGTVLSDDAGAHDFRAAWEALDPERRPLLVYNSHRTVADIQWLILERRLPAAEFIIGGLGTEIMDPLDAHVADEFRGTLDASWDAAAVAQIVGTLPDVRLQRSEYLTAHRLSWHWVRANRADVARLEARLHTAGLDVRLSYTGDVFLDIVPSRAGKGNALAWLCSRIGVPLENVVVAGASASNISMFGLPGVRGILPVNSSSELFAATSRAKPIITLRNGPLGVLAGLRQLGVIDSEQTATLSPEAGRFR
jgi:hydroxymethylpyrimidine pyrophosphatase-like HAD family hydrolase